MFITAQRHNTALAERDSKIAALESQLRELEAQLVQSKIDAHDIVESVRYTLGASASILKTSNSESAGMLHGLGESLPYVLSGSHDWPNRHSLALVPNGKAAAEEVAIYYGISLPADPALSVRILLDIAIVLMQPDRALILELWRNNYPSAAL